MLVDFSLKFAIKAAPVEQRNEFRQDFTKLRKRTAPSKKITLDWPAGAGVQLRPKCVPNYPPRLRVVSVPRA
jgi:hypothetical protein